MLPVHGLQLFLQLCPFTGQLCAQPLYHSAEGKTDKV